MLGTGESGLVIGSSSEECLASICLTLMTQKLRIGGSRQQ
jgi:hypothetical protein